MIMDPRFSGYETLNSRFEVLDMFERSLNGKFEHRQKGDPTKSLLIACGNV